MNLPPPIRAYFEADQADAQHPPLQAFSPHAAVLDEGATHRGHAAIGDWWRAAKAKYAAVANPLEVWSADGATKVRARVSGDFPNSPADLVFAFVLAGDRIRRLEIGA